jgi:hypothetical protein
MRLEEKLWELEHHGSYLYDKIFKVHRWAEWVNFYKNLEEASPDPWPDKRRKMQDDPEVSVDANFLTNLEGAREHLRESVEEMNNVLRSIDPYAENEETGEFFEKPDISSVMAAYRSMVTHEVKGYCTRLSYKVEDDDIRDLPPIPDKSTFLVSHYRNGFSSLREVFAERLIPNITRKEGVSYNLSQLADGDERLDVRCNHMISILINELINNASDASSEDDTVTVTYALEDNKLVVNVTNPAYIAKDTIDQITKQGYSTKGKGRGHGLASVKQIVETDYDGIVTITSSRDEGTTVSLKFERLTLEGSYFESGPFSWREGYDHVFPGVPLGVRAVWQNRSGEKSRLDVKFALPKGDMPRYVQNLETFKKNSNHTSSDSAAWELNSNRIVTILIQEEDAVVPLVSLLGKTFADQLNVEDATNTFTGLYNKLQNHG